MQGNAAEKHPEVVLAHEIGTGGDALRGHLRGDLGDVGVDGAVALRVGDGHTVVPVLHEMHRSHPVHGDRGHGLAAPPRGRDAFPPGAQACRGGAETTVEVVGTVDAADDRGDLDDLQPESPFTEASEGCDDVVEGQHRVDVGRFAAQPCDQPGVLGAPALPGEIVAGIGDRKTGVASHASTVPRGAQVRV